MTEKATYKIQDCEDEKLYLTFFESLENLKPLVLG